MSLIQINPSQQVLLQGLNQKQTDAVLSTQMSTLVIAGAGSGKTAVLTRRCAFLIAGGLEPGKILSLTFTNKAAREMRHRVKQILAKTGLSIPDVPVWMEDYQNSPLLCTFHSLGVKLLREFGDTTGLKKEFGILDTDDQKKIVKRILKERNISEKVVSHRMVLYFISKCKQELLQASQSQKVEGDFLPIFHQAYKAYEEELRSSQVVDFDDLLLLSHKLLSTQKEVLDAVRERWHHVQVDEFQDTNFAQFELIKLLCPAEALPIDDFRSLFVVGDDAQSIYGFRGSKIEIILNFEQQYPGTTEIILNQNYRSTQPILDLAEKILTHNPHQKKKDLFTQNKEDLQVCYYHASNDLAEADFIIRSIYQKYVNNQANQQPSQKTLADLDQEPNQEHQNDQNNLDLIFESDHQPSSQNRLAQDIASSTRDSVSDMFDIYMESEDVSFSPNFKSIQEYSPKSWVLPKANWKQVKDLEKVAVLYRTHTQSRAIEEQFLKNNVPYRLVSGVKFLDRKEIKDVLAILKFLANGSDKVSLGRFLPLIMEGVGPKTMQKILAYMEDYDYPLSPKVSEKLLQIFSKMQSMWLNNDNLIDLTKDLLVATGYFNYLKKQYPQKEDYEMRMENIGEIYSLMLTFDKDPSIDIAQRLNDFLAYISLMTNQDDSQDDSPKVSLMSLHQSKGLEFETVFLVGIEDGILPHQNSLIEPNGFEEEVRLAYVGVTRAKRNLYLTSANTRTQFGQIKLNPVSRIFRPFLDKYCQRVV